MTRASERASTRARVSLCAAKAPRALRLTYAPYAWVGCCYLCQSWLLNVYTRYSPLFLSSHPPTSPSPLPLCTGHRGKTLWKRKRARRKKFATYVYRKKKNGGRRRKVVERQKGVTYKKGNNNLLRRTCITRSALRVRYALRPINVAPPSPLSRSLGHPPSLD